MSHLIIVCCRPNPDGDCGLSVLLALQCVPDRAGLSRWEPGIRVDPDGQLSIAVRLTVLLPWLMRSLSAVLQAAPRTYGWCRTRWSWATLAATLQATHGSEVSAETVRRWLHELGWVWKRAKSVRISCDSKANIERW